MDIVELADNNFERNSQQILQKISWKIKKGEHWALIGPNGAGKTTLLKIISGNLWPSSGTVKVLGKEFGKTDLRELRKKIGWASSYLVEKIPERQNVFDVVLSGKNSSFGIYDKINENDRKRAKNLLEFMDCLALKDSQFNVTSQGERQKVLIARALMPKPLILILDEPCSGLDMKSRKNLMGAVSKICRGGKAAVIYVTHHFEEIVPEIGNIFMMKDGKTFMQGKSKEILNQENIGKLFS